MNRERTIRDGAGSIGPIPLQIYVPGPESQSRHHFAQIMFQAEHNDDEIVAEDQPCAEDASPTSQSPDNVQSLIEAYPEEMTMRNPERIQHGDIEAMKDARMREHLAPADSVVVALPATNQALSAEEIESFKTDEFAATPPPHPAYRSLPELPLYLTSPTSHSPHGHHHFQDTVHATLPLSPPSPVLSPAPPPSPIRSLGYRATMIWIRAEAASTSHSLLLPPPFILSPTRPDAPSLGIPPPLPISVPTSSPPLLLPSASRREDRPEVTLPPQKRLCIALGPGYEVGDSSSAVAVRPAGGLRADYGFIATIDREIRRDPEREVGYGITDSWDEIVETLQGAPVSTNTELGRHMIVYEIRVRQDTDEIYMRLDIEQSQRQLLAGRLNMLFRDRRAHAYTLHLMDTEARLSREA
ncbi:hypothetical protein Tco_0653478 [Tanacetum coccineum]|uniref:Uncharacterized protein n=1 Tax=Tanacetum coccineum TaxID=301880 RepID=A0ABQ4X0I3_9ASTR